MSNTRRVKRGVRAGQYRDDAPYQAQSSGLADGATSRGEPQERTFRCGHCGISVVAVMPPFLKCGHCDEEHPLEEQLLECVTCGHKITVDPL